MLDLDMPLLDGGNGFRGRTAHPHHRYRGGGHRAARLDITARTSGETVTLIVDDNGSGIPAAERAHAFERFYRAGRNPGRGIGLALVAQQARLHGGTAALGASPSGGARLTVTPALPETGK